MEKYALILAAVVLFIFVSLAGLCANSTGWDNISGENLNLRTLLFNPDNPEIIYAGSSNAVLKSDDGAETWRDVLTIRGKSKAVNFLLFDPRDRNYLYAATGNGLFYTADQGSNWRRIFRGKNYLENECTTLAVLPYCIYLGTKAGLFTSKDGGHSWQKGNSKLGSSHILAIACDTKEQNRLYAACVDGVFETKDGGRSWERIFVGNSTMEENNDDIEEEPEEQEGAHSIGIRYLAIDQNNLSCLYLATSRGVYISRDKGENWEALPSFGLLNRDVKFLLVSPESSLYAVTKSGIFEHKNERWHELSLGLPATEINFLSLGKDNTLYATTDKGLFRAAYPDCNAGGQILSSYYNGEPGINDVRQAAIKYAEVGPEKITRWRKQAKVKALLPKLTVGLDRSENTNYEIYTSATTRYVYEGPQDKSSGWDVTLSWDLGDLIWNDAQTSIDVRSRLMVELRDDILDEVTKLYFERIRSKMELDNLSIEDRKKRFEKELRIQELTASLDALTGGYFSARLPR